MLIVPDKPPAYFNHIYCGLFEERCRVLDDQCVDLVLTSPPYANQRKKQYGGISEDDYPGWTVGWMDCVKRLLKPHGCVAIIINPHTVNGVESDYVIDTIFALQDAGWVLHRTCWWGKPDSAPMGRIDRPREATEMILWLSLGRQPFCNARGDASTLFLVGTSRNDRAKWNTHPAPFPVMLAERIIKVFCPRRGVVLDPFIGSGSTAVAALKTGRKYIGFEKEMKYVNIARRRVNIAQSNEISPAH